MRILTPLLCFAISTLCYANTTYQGSISTGIDTVYYTIVTDDTLGALSTGNILSASFYDVGDLAWSEVSAQVSISAGIYSPNELTATADGLFFDFSGTQGDIFQLVDTNDGFYVYLNDYSYTYGQCCFTLVNVNGYSPTYPAHNGVTIYESDDQQIASFVAPEPGTLAMFLGGLTLLAVLPWGRRSWRQTAIVPASRTGSEAA